MDTNKYIVYVMQFKSTNILFKKFLQFYYHNYHLSSPYYLYINEFTNLLNNNKTNKYISNFTINMNINDIININLFNMLHVILHENVVEYNITILLIANTNGIVQKEYNNIKNYIIHEQY